MMRPTRSKHGLDRKYKPWRKGKSSSSKNNSKPRGDDDENGGGDNRRRATSSGTSSISHTNASLKNMLRSQKRLLDKLERGGHNPTSNTTTTTTTTNNNNNREALIDTIKQKIHQLEQDIRAHEAKEREKKNAVKYHQVKFIERQKITRLEKSLKRQLQQILLEQQNQQRTNDSEEAKSSATTSTSIDREQTQQQISLLQQQLQSIAMDQLYIAFFPTNMKYMALFTNGMNRVVDDERGQKRRKAVWNVIREGLLAESSAEPMEEQERMQQMKSHDGSGSSSSSSGSRSDDDSSSVPSDDSDSEIENESDKKAGTSADKSMKEPNNKFSLKNTKTWVNLDEAKRALLSMPVDTYPNDPSIVVTASASGSALSKQHKNNAPKNENEAKRSLASTELNSNKGKNATAKASDSRFELSKGLDGLFHESTTGQDDNC
ncbi:hypothetical protein ACHAWU_004655 [Discostella pseudostelligera]|uniref:rRNA-processing protein EFG1 n=1 Tax=Discostella pseudostelligera TaxID=259834 RepID=A0ABD3N9Z7_9STRA